MARPRKKTNLSKKSGAKDAPLSRNGIIFLIIIGVLFVGSVIWLALIQNSNASDPAALGNLPLEIEVQEAYDLYQQGVFLLDVRTQGEWDEIHVPNATLIPLDQLENRLNELPRDEEIVVMCRSGNRSQTGRDILLNAGFESITSMRGGIKDWEAAGFPTTP